MIKPSKYFLAFASLFVLLGAGIFIVSQKFLPILLQHTIYYCQTALHSFSMRIPGGIGTFLTGLLFLLVGYAITKLMVSYVKVVSFRRKLHAQTRLDEVFNQLVDTLNLRDKAFLVSSSKPFAFCHGIWHPKIYISTALFNMMNTSELEAILRHEQYHLDYKDGLTMLFAEIAKSLFPFFPLLADLIHSYQIEREIKADYQATNGLGTSQSLVSVLKKLLLYEPIEQYVFTPALADHETLEMRIKALTNKDYYFMKFSMLNIVISILSIGAFMALVIAPVQAVKTHDYGNDVMMVCLQNDSCSAWCRENKTVFPYSKLSNISIPHAPMTPAFSSVQ
ncbi:M56 family metallopeptidase [Candidatus Gottesmanbacteria bacterium]|nr:M56 family metallopeptidase [Candidatus Gottesmanbacteria bacterium]